MAPSCSPEADDDLGPRRWLPIIEPRTDPCAWTARSAQLLKSRKGRSTRCGHTSIEAARATTGPSFCHSGGIPGRIIKLRRTDACARCSRPLDAGVEASWDASARTVTCTSCLDMPAKMAADVAGASARATGERLRSKEADRRRQRVERRPILGRLANAMDGPNTAGASHTKGAGGEEKLGAALDGLVSRGLFVLHDRRRPRTAANIDHLVIAPNGVWVVDAKRYSGLVTKVDKGGWLRSDLRLVIGGRDRTKLVEGVHKQVADVRQVLTRSNIPDVTVHGVLCFVDAEFPLFAKPFAVDGVLIIWGKALRERMAVPGPLTADQRAELHRLLAATLPPAR